MKRLQLSGAMLGLTVLLTACPGNPPVPAATYSLTVKVEGVGSAPVTVTNTTTDTQVFKGTVEGSKTFADLKAGSVFKVEGGAVNGYTAPAAQTVTLDANKTVALTYAAVSQPGTALDPARVRGTLAGWTFKTGELGVLLTNEQTLADATTPTISSTGAVDAGLPTPRALQPFLQGCTFTGEQSATDFGSEFVFLPAFSEQGDYLGDVSEHTTDGRPVFRVYSDTAARFKGTALCGDTGRLDLDIQVVRGWNALSITEVGSGNLRIRSVEAGTRTTLTFERAAESVGVFFRDNSGLTLRAGEQATREVVLARTGGISGPITLETSVPGVTVTPSTVNLPSLSAAKVGGGGLKALSAAVRPQALGTSLTFSADRSARGYSGSLDVIVRKSGTEAGRGTLYSFNLLAPSVSVSIANAYNGVSLYQGGTSGVEVNVGSIEGFSGSTTLTVTGLPAGVTAAPVTVQVTPGAITTVTIPLTATADATLSSTSVRVTGSDVSSIGNTDTVQLNVKPARTLLGSVSSITPAAQGVWFAAGSSTDGSSQVIFRRVAGGKTTQEVTLANASAQLLPIPGGDVYVLPSSGNTVYRLKDDGTTTALTAPNAYALSFGAVDSEGRIWFVGIAGEQIGSYTYGLSRWDPATGSVTVVDTSHSYGSGSGSQDLKASNDGKFLLYRGRYDIKPLLIDTSTSAIREINNSVGTIDTVAVSNTGEVWFTAYGQPTRVNADGSTTTFQFQASLIGFDQQNPQILWATSSNSVLKINPETGTYTSIPTDGGNGVVNRDGGVSLLTNEYVNGNYQSYLTVLR